MGHSFPFEGMNAMLQGVVLIAPLTLSSVESDHPRIVIVEDDGPTRRFLADNLAADGFEPLEAANARDGLRLIANRAPALAVLDLGLPDRDGLDVLHELRAGEATISRIDPTLPVLVLSGRATEMDRVRGFERGADDYLVKPFSYLELRGRIDAVLRRSRSRPGAGRLKVGPLELDPALAPRSASWMPAAGVQEGIRAAAHAGLRAGPGVHARGTAARRLGLSVDRSHPHAGLARLAAAAQAL